MRKENENLSTKQEKYIVICRPAIPSQTIHKQNILRYNFNKSCKLLVHILDKRKIGYRLSQSQQTLNNLGR